MLLVLTPLGYSLGLQPWATAPRTVRMQQEPPPNTPPDSRKGGKRPNSKVQATGISDEVDQFLEDAEEFIEQMQTGVFDRKIAKIVANSETKLLDRLIKVGRNALSVLSRVSRHGQSAPARGSPSGHPLLWEPAACSGPSSGERREIPRRLKAEERPAAALLPAVARLSCPSEVADALSHTGEALEPSRPGRA